MRTKTHKAKKAEAQQRLQAEGHRQAVLATGPACYHCGALDWDYDEDRLTTCCQSN